jgi:hypothetical protein
MKHKSKVYSHLQRYITWIENQSGQQVKCLRSDNGSEYVSYAIIELLRSKGIEHQLMMSYTAEQNGVVEHGGVISFGLTCKHLNLQCMSIPVHLRISDASDPLGDHRTCPTYVQSSPA